MFHQLYYFEGERRVRVMTQEGRLPSKLIYQTGTNDASRCCDLEQKCDVISNHCSPFFLPLLTYMSMNSCLFVWFKLAQNVQRLTSDKTRIRNQILWCNVQLHKLNKSDQRGHCLQIITKISIFDFSSNCPQSSWPVEQSKYVSLFKSMFILTISSFSTFQHWNSSKSVT